MDNIVTKQSLIDNFDPNGVASIGALFGLPFGSEQADVVLLEAPWEVTVSFNSGTAAGPRHILEASGQVDLYDPEIENAWQAGISFEQPSQELEQLRHLGSELRLEAQAIIEAQTDSSASNKTEQETQLIYAKIEHGCRTLNTHIYERASYYLKQNKIVGLVGGDHSTPLGLMRALADVYPEYGILQIDAHADLRQAYEGFEFSHASIMYNALKIEQIQTLVQVGIRDYCQEEADLIKQNPQRIRMFSDAWLKKSGYEGRNWKQICDEIIERLPKHVYISFDIDGLDPKLCPNTGTPVPGGLEFEQVIYLFKSLVKKGNIIIGFDLVEVAEAGDQAGFDANVGARLLYKMANLAAVSQGRLVGNL